jgi:hypothetical protein
MGSIGVKKRVLPVLVQFRRAGTFGPIAIRF